MSDLRGLEHIDLHQMMLEMGLDVGFGGHHEMDEIFEALSYEGDPKDMPHVISRQLDDATEEEHQLIRELVIDDGNTAVLAEYVLGYKPEEHHRTMLNWQRMNREGLLLAWRGAAKSTYCTKAFIITEILRNPNIRILITADAVDQSKGFLREIKWHFEKNEKFRAIFGDWSTGASVWSDTLITVNKRTASYSEPTITCAGIKTSLPSRHFDLILADDLVTLDNSKTEGERKRVRDYFYQTMYPTLEQPHGRLYVIGTRWHRDDLYGWLQENDYKNAHLVLGALDESGDEPVSRWEAKFKTETLLRIRNASLEAFELQYMCRTGEGLGDIFNDKMFIIDDGLWPIDVNRWQGVDLAVGQRAHNDPFAHTTLDMQKVSMLSFLQHFYKGQKTFPQQVEFVKQMYERYPQTKGVVVESNAYQAALPQQVRENFPDVPVIQHYTKVDKITRAQQLALFLIQRPCRVRSEHREFVRLLIGFPNVKGSKDVFDAFWLAHNRARRGKKNRRKNEVGLL